MFVSSLLICNNDLEFDLDFIDKSKLSDKPIFDFLGGLFFFFFLLLFLLVLFLVILLFLLYILSISFFPIFIFLEFIIFVISFTKRRYPHLMNNNIESK